MKKNEYGEYVFGYFWFVVEYKWIQENKNERCYEQVVNVVRCVFYMYLNFVKYCRGDFVILVEYDFCIFLFIIMIGVESDV